MSNGKTIPAAEQRKLKFTGNCTLSNAGLEMLYNLDLLDDAELASVGLERGSLIDDYRHLHEMSQLHRLALRDPNGRAARRRANRLKLKKLRASDPNNLKNLRFGCKLLNQLIMLLQEMGFETEAPIFCRYMEVDFNIYTKFHSNPKMLALPAKQREYRRFVAHCEYLDKMYLNGNRTEAMDLVVDTLIKFTKKRDRSKRKYMMIDNLGEAKLA